LKEVFIFMRTW